jgi:hypothetical protein
LLIVSNGGKGYRRMARTKPALSYEGGSSSDEEGREDEGGEDESTSYEEE